MIFFKKLYVFLIFLKCFKFQKQQFYISNSSNCLQICDGSFEKPFSNLLQGLSSVYKKLWLNLNPKEENISIKLISDQYSISEKDILDAFAQPSFMLDKFSSGKYYGLFGQISKKIITIIPNGCSIEKCSRRVNISFKTSILVFQINSSIFFSHINFYGNDLNLPNIHQKYCIKTDCCKISMLFNSSDLKCGLINKVINRKNKNPLKSLFILVGSSSNLNIISSQFLYFNSINVTHGYTSLVGKNNSQSVNFIGRVNFFNITIFRSYLKFGVIYFIDTNCFLIFKNINISEYDNFNLSEKIGGISVSSEYLFKFYLLESSKNYLNFSNIEIKKFYRFLVMDKGAITMQDINIILIITEFHSRHCIYIKYYSNVFLNKIFYHSNPNSGYFLYVIGQ